MAELIKTKKGTNMEEFLRSKIIVYQALIDILIAKEIISEAELVYSIGRLTLEKDELQ